MSATFSLRFISPPQEWVQSDCTTASMAVSVANAPIAYSMTTKSAVLFALDRRSEEQFSGSRGALRCRGSEQRLGSVKSGSIGGTRQGLQPVALGCPHFEVGKALDGGGAQPFVP